MCIRGEFLSQLHLTMAYALARSRAIAAASRRLAGGHACSQGGWQAATRAFSTAPMPGFFEVRIDDVAPGNMSAYMAEHDLRAGYVPALFPGWKGTFKTEVRPLCLEPTRLRPADL